MYRQKKIRIFKKSALLNAFFVLLQGLYQNKADKEEMNQIFK
jgi:hypothetical protein